MRFHIERNITVFLAYPLSLLGRPHTKHISILFLFILSALIVTSGCSSIKEYPEDWPALVDVSPSLCPSLAGSYANAAGSGAKVYREKVVIAMPGEGVLEFEEHVWKNKTYQKEYSEKEKTLVCSSSRAILGEGVKWGAYDGGLVSKKREIILSKDANGFLIVEERSTLTTFCLVVPMFDLTNNSWSRFAPTNDNQ